MKSLPKLCLAAVLLISTGCYIESSLTLSKDNKLDQILISIDSGEDIVEASVRHGFNLLGLRDAFTIREKGSGDFSMESYLEMTAREPIHMPFKAENGDNVKISDLGDGQYKLSWNLEQRVQEFVKEKSEDDAEKVFLVVKITFPGEIEIANTSENYGSMYVCRFTQRQISEPLKITALYSI